MILRHGFSTKMIWKQVTCDHSCGVRCRCGTRASKAPGSTQCGNSSPQAVLLMLLWLDMDHSGIVMEIME